MAPTSRARGKRATRLDSPPKLTGHEKFTGDLRFPGMLRARLIGSDYAHARIVSVNAEGALQVPGVVAVLTSKDLPVARAENGASPISILADGEALYVGHPVAVVLAETDQAARDAVDLITVDYEELDVLIDLEAAAAEDAPKVSLGGAGAFADEALMHNDDTTVVVTDDHLRLNVSCAICFQRCYLEKRISEGDEIA